MGVCGYARLEYNNTSVIWNSRNQGCSKKNIVTYRSPTSTYSLALSARQESIVKYEVEKFGHTSKLTGAVRVVVELAEAPQVGALEANTECILAAGNRQYPLPKVTDRGGTPLETGKGAVLGTPSEDDTEREGNTLETDSTWEEIPLDSDSDRGGTPLDEGLLARGGMLLETGK